MSEKEFIEVVKKDDLLKDIIIQNINLNFFKPVFILCQNSLSNYPNIKNIINRQISENDKALISSSSLSSYSIDEIKVLHNTKKEIAIVNNIFLIKIGISPYMLNQTDIYYFSNKKKKILFFKSKGKALSIENKNELSLPNRNVNNIPILKSEIRINVLNSLILIYANKKEIIRKLSSNLSDKLNFENFTLINKEWIDKFKEKFYYKDIKTILLQYQNTFSTYNDYEINLSFLHSIAQLKKIEERIREIPDILSKQIKLIPCLRIDQKNSELKWPINFEIIHESLFNILKTFSIYINDLNNYQLEYKIIYGKSSLYLQSTKMPNIFYVYSFDNNIIYKFVGFITFKNDFLFQAELNQFLKDISFRQYLINRNIDINKFNQKQFLLNSNNETIGELSLIRELDYKGNYPHNIINQETNIQFNEIIQSEQIINQNSIPQHIPKNQNNLFNQIGTNFQNLNIGEKKNDISNPYYIIFQNYKKFINDFKEMKNINLAKLEINIIDAYISQKTFVFLSVYLIDIKNSKYCFEYLNFKYYSQLEKAKDEKEKEKIRKSIQKFEDFSLINFYVIPLIPDDYTIQDSSYSLVNEDFCKGIKLTEDKYKPFEALLFKSNNNYFLYYKNKKKLLFRITNFNINYTNNSFKLSKINSLKENKPIPTNPDTDTDILIPCPPSPSIPPDSDHCLGLENIGATCYMNATLQCLCHVTSLKKYFQNPSLVNKDINNKETPMTNSFCELLNKLWKQTYETYYAPHNFKNLISKLNPLFKGIQANDSKDLIIFIYETLHNELNNPNSNSDILNSINKQNLPTELKLFRQNYFSQNNSIMTKIFYSEQSSNLECYSCRTNKVSFNIINFLIFPLEKIRLYLEKKKPQGFINVTLEDCFDQFEEKELLFGPNQIYCNNCHRQSNAISYNKLFNSPEVLTIILNRGKGLQFDVEFQFPFDLNINKYVIDQTCDTNYELIGVLTHLGPSGMSGHFIAYCKSPVNGQWYCYNDAEVTQCQNVMHEINSNGIPYVLYYQRKNIPTIIEGKNEQISFYNFNNNNEKKKDVLDFNYEGKEAFIYLNIEENPLFYDIFQEVKNKFDNKPINDLNNCYIIRNNNNIPIDLYKGVKDNGLKNNDKIYIGNNYKNTMNDNPFVLIFTYEGKEINVNIKIEEYKLLFEIICDLKNKNEIPQEANNFFLMKDNDMVRIDTLKGVQENGLKNGDKICVIV